MTRRVPAAVSARAEEWQWRGKDRVAQVRRRVPEGCVGLTFDDGPQPGSTDRILDVLAELGVRVTFFCVGRNARAHPELVHRIRAGGHAVGSHSMTHPLPWETARAQLRQEYAEGRRTVSEVLGADVRLFRPPHGHIDPAGAVMLRRLPVDTWLWTVDPTDWRPGATVEEIVSVAGRAASRDVVLFHDWVEHPLADEALDRSATIAALPIVVAAIRERGLALETLSP
ncbi:polysaccharide deacetylase family protein [Geodermatophilus sp. SYSU D01176]